MSISQLTQSGVDQVINGKSFIDTLSNCKYLVVPSHLWGIGGFVFDYEKRTSVEMSADITDHYSEDNSAVHDHIALKPVKLTLSGFVGELAQNKSTRASAPSVRQKSKLAAVSFIDDYTPGAIQAIQAATSTSQSASDTVNAVASYASTLLSNTSIAKTKQQQAYHELEAMFLSKQVVMVVTPYRVFNSMAIESLSFSQDEDTQYISDITVTLKQLRFANNGYSSFDETKFAGRANAQRAENVDTGNTKGTEKDMAKEMLSTGLV